MTRTGSPAIPTLATLTTIAAISSACSELPRDNYGTLERIRREHVLRVGAAENRPWVEPQSDDVRGLEAELVQSFARQHGARVEWTRGPQIELAERLHDRQLDILIAGLRANTPLHAKLALTRPYATTRDPDGSSADRVLAVMPGESQLLYQLDRFLLDDARAEAVRRRAEAAR